MTTEALQVAIDLIERPSTTTTSEQLERARDALERDIADAKHSLALLEGHHGRLMVSAVPDREIEAAGVEIRTAELALSRRAAVVAALKPLIEAALRREAKVDFERWAEEIRLTQLSVVADYVALDANSIRVVELLNSIRAKEATIADANAQFRAAGKGAMQVGLPMDELSVLTGVAGEHLPWISKFRLHGYTDNSAGNFGDADYRPIDPARRFGRLAALLPAGGEPAPAAKPAAPQPTVLVKQFDGTLQVAPAPVPKPKLVA